MTDIVTVPADAEPVSVSWAKNHLRLVISDDDDMIRHQYLMAAREQVQSDTGRLFVTQTRTLYLDDFQNVIHIPYSPVRSLVSIKYLDQSQVEQTLALSNVVTDASGEFFRITLADDALWPIVDDVPGAVRVQYRAGYAAKFTAANATNTFTSAAHDLEDGDAVRVFTLGGTMPAGLSAGVYYVTGKTADTFQLSTTSGGSAVSISDDGSGDLFVSDGAGYEFYTRMTQALLLLVGNWYENRESVMVGQAPALMPHSYNYLVGGLSRSLF